MTPDVECLVDSRCSLGESPLWLADCQSLCWLDIGRTSRLFEWSSRTREVRQWTLAEVAGGLTLGDDHTLIVVSRSGVSRFDRQREALQPLMTLPFSMQGIRFNDCGCDPTGRLWTGTMVSEFDPPPANPSGASIPAMADKLLSIGTDLTCQAHADGVRCPNTFVWSLDDRTFYTADSAAQCLYAYAFEPATGAIAERRVFAAPDELGIPDGSALDAEGYLWNARWGAGCVVRFAPGGHVDTVVPIPAQFVTSCAFGGEALDTLFVTTARPAQDAATFAQRPQSGGIFAFKPTVPGAPVPRFRGRHAATK